MTPLAAIHVAKKQLGLDEDTYRALLTRVTGKASAKAMSPAEHQAVLAELRRSGFKAVPGGSNGALKGRSKGLQGPYAKKLQALWIAGWNLGIVRDRTDAAMLAFIKRQTGIEHTAFLRDSTDAKKAVEALKGWLARDGGVKWGTSSGTDFLTHDPGKVAWAQFRIMVPGATLMGNTIDFRRAIADLGLLTYAGQPLGTLTPADWRTVMNAWGERIRRKGP